jgi:hypothetical protein
MIGSKKNSYSEPKVEMSFLEKIFLHLFCFIPLNKFYAIYNINQILRFIKLQVKHSLDILLFNLKQAHNESKKLSIVHVLTILKFFV